MKLTIGQLKEEIANLSDDAKVVVRMHSGCCGDVEYMDVIGTDSCLPGKIFGKDFTGHLEINLAPLPGYESCISAGRMSELSKQIATECVKREKPQRSNKNAKLLNKKTK